MVMYEQHNNRQCWDLYSLTDAELVNEYTHYRKRLDKQTITPMEFLSLLMIESEGNRRLIELTKPKEKTEEQQIEVV